MAAALRALRGVDVIRKTLKDLPDLEPEKLALAESTMVAQAPNALARFDTGVRAIVDPDGPPHSTPNPPSPPATHRGPA